MKHTHRGIARQVPVISILLFSLAGFARGDLVNGDFEGSPAGSPPASWNSTNTTTVVYTVVPTTNQAAFMAGTALTPATMLQQFKCDDASLGLTFCEISFRYRFGNAGFGSLKIMGQNGGWSRTDTILAPNDTDWHDATFLFNDGSCGQTLAIGFTGVEAIYIDDVTDACVAPVPEPGSFAALGLGAIAVLRRRATEKR